MVYIKLNFKFVIIYTVKIVWTRLLIGSESFDHGLDFQERYFFFEERAEIR